MVHDGAGVRLTISREAAEQVSGVTCGIGLSRRAKDLLSLSGAGKGELGVRKVFAESDPVVVSDPEDPLSHDEVLHPWLSPDRLQP